MKTTTALRPSILIDWDDGSGSLDMGSRFNEMNTLFRADVLRDILHDVKAAYDATREELYPGWNRLQQKSVNAMRRVCVESMVGRTVKAARALTSGHVALELDDGRVLIFCCKDDVEVGQVESMESAIEYAKGICSSRRYTEEPTAADRKYGEERVRKGMLKALRGG